MQIRIIAVGKTKEQYLQQGIAEFCKRLQPYAKVEQIIVPEEKLGDNMAAREEEQVREKEGQALLKNIKPTDHVIVLDVKGRTLTSEGLAEHLGGLALHGKSSVAFVVGGALGLAPTVRHRADFLLSFSSFTFTHQLIRLLLLEQIYRAFKIQRGEPYHR